MTVMTDMNVITGDTDASHLATLRSALPDWIFRNSEITLVSKR